MSTEELRRYADGEYEAYRRDVVGACIPYFGEQARGFFMTQCSFEVEFAERRSPEEVAHDQWEAST